MKWYRFVTRVLVEGLAVAALFTSTTAWAAGAVAARPAGAATGYQYAMIAKVLAHNPAARRIGSNEVEWDNGAIFLRVPRSPKADVGSCANNYVCVWSGEGWTG